MTEERDIITTEIGYHLIAELITMRDRVLAQKIELDIWANSPTPRYSRLKAYIEALKASGDGSEFRAAAELIVQRSEIIFTIGEDGSVGAYVPS